MTDIDLFEKGTRKKVRFSSPVGNFGNLTMEDMWDLPLKSEKGASVDNIAQAVNAKLKAASTESFVDTSQSPETKTLELKLEILKHIIAVRKAENAAERQRTENKREKEKLLEILSRKQDAELEGLSTEEIQERIEALS